MRAKLRLPPVRNWAIKELRESEISRSYETPMPERKSCEKVRYGFKFYSRRLKSILLNVRLPSIMKCTSLRCLRKRRRDPMSRCVMGEQNFLKSIYLSCKGL